MEKKLLIIIDSNALIHRAYHALPPLTTKKGELVNAIYGFLLVFFKAIKEFQPDFVIAAFDLPGPTFRHKAFKEYKATRPKTPEELVQQIPKIKEILRSFNVPIFEKKGFEADDIIGTISKRSFNSVSETIIISGDLDILQLVDSHTKVYTLRKGVKDTVLYDRNLVKKRYDGLNPEQLNDFRALKGDPSDNIPGVLGIGEKTAVKLIKEFGNIENLYKELEEKNERAEKLKPLLKKNLLDSKKIAFLSKALSQIKIDVPLELDFEKYQWKTYDKEKVGKIFKNLEFYSLISRL
jgi:DNA polymerase-1